MMLAVSSLLQQLIEHPVRIFLEFIFISALVYFFTHRKNRKRQAALSKMPSPEEQERRLAEFASRDFHEDSIVTTNLVVPDFKGVYKVEGRQGCHITLRDGLFEKPTECLDLATFDYHSFSTLPEIVEVARKTVMAYGVGSCGPRGFYGTIKPHIEFEKYLAKFCGTDDAIIYSFSYTTVATLLSCYASKLDYMICDRGVNSAVLEGCLLTRCQLLYFEHNDMASLEKQLQAVVAKENSAKPQRRFVVTEGVFRDTGDLCLLPKILELCLEYKFRLVLEDSYGFGALGKTGRGTPDHYGIPISQVDIYIGSMSTSMGAVGGFCAGEGSMIDFQRLGSAAYVFSASLPPYVTAATLAALKLLDKDYSYVERLLENSQFIRRTLRDAHLNSNKIALVGCDRDASPLIMLQVLDSYVKEITLLMAENKLQRVINAVAKNKIALLRHIYSTHESTHPMPTLRIVAKSQMTESELSTAMDIIVCAIKEEFS